MKSLFCFLALLLFYSAEIPAQLSPSPAVPEFRFIQKNGRAFTRQQLKTGKPLFFVFFDITCEHCQRALAYLDGESAALAKAAVYLVTMDPGPQAEAFLSIHASSLLRLPNSILLRDTRNQFITLFHPRKYPSLFLYSAQQKLLLYSDEEKDLPDFIALMKTAK